VRKKYCAFWIPSINYGVPRLIGDAFTPEVDASDVDNKNHEHLISVEVKLKEEEIEHIRVVSKMVDTTSSSLPREVVILLKEPQSSHTGMMSFSYEIDEADEQMKAVDKIMPTFVYHLIKGLFHKHEYHIEGRDSALKGLVSEDPVWIKGKDNEALVHYLGEYEKKFLTYRRVLIDKLSETKERYEQFKETSFEDLQELFLGLDDARKLHSDIDALCHNALGESVYYQSLKRSYDICREDSKSRQRLALNIQHALESIRLLQIENKNLWDARTYETMEALHKYSEILVKEVGHVLQENTNLTTQVHKMQLDNDRLAKLSYRLGLWGFIIGLLGFIVGVWGLLSSIFK
jgi:hypothetical protein